MFAHSETSQGSPDNQVAVLGALLSALSESGNSSLTKSLRDSASASPALFFDAAMRLLQTASSPIVLRRLYTRVADCPEFFFELVKPGRFSREDLLEVCGRLMKIDYLLDIKLARLLPTRGQPETELPSNTIVYILDILNEISPGPRLILTLSHLSHHPHQHVASKATLLLARRVRNKGWVERHLQSTDARVRASTVEALWSANDPSTRAIFRQALQDDNNRVVGNALVGLHLLGEVGLGPFVTEMLKDARPAFRWTAAWVAGRIGAPEFREPLRQALSDPQSGVRIAARRALVSMRQPAAPSQEEPTPAAVKESEPPASASQPGTVVAPKPPDSPSETPAESPVPDSGLKLNGHYLGGLH